MGSMEVLRYSMQCIELLCSQANYAVEWHILKMFVIVADKWREIMKNTGWVINQALVLGDFFRTGL